jgi:hypothetical protein
VSPTRSVFYSYGLATQAMYGHYLTIADGRNAYSTIPFRYVWPSELDLMAQLAGLDAARRVSMTGRRWKTLDSVDRGGARCRLMETA